jgi:murein DD-endopeptidase MepM/ murein hydrolase activator NlpD
MSNGVCFIAISALGSALLFFSVSPAAGDDSRIVSISYNRASSSSLEENREYADGGYFLKDYAKSKKVIKNNPDKGKKIHNPYNTDHNKNPYKISPHSKKKTTNYKVNKGETLYSISRKFNIPFNDLCNLNDFSGDEKIKSGAVIKVPFTEKSMKDEIAENSPENNFKDNPADKNKKISFIWPVRDVKNYKQDGADGIKPIGIIITGNPGAKVYPSADGSVEKIGNMRGFGKYVVVRHEGKFVTVYSNLDKISVTEGQKITTKSSIGKINSLNAKLHFQIDYAGKPKNPAAYLPAKS